MRHGETALRVGLGAVALAGLAVSGYLTAVRAAGESPVCVIGGGCSTVQDSKYAEIAGIPVAVLGLVAYATLLVAALWPGALGRVVGLFTAIVGVGFSAFLTYLELFVIEAICAWCVTSAVLIVIALALAVARARLGGGGGGTGRGRAGEEGPRAAASKPEARAG